MRTRKGRPIGEGEADVPIPPPTESNEFVMAQPVDEENDFEKDLQVSQKV